MTISWTIYFVNGYTLHTKEWRKVIKKTVNSGVHVKDLAKRGKYDFYCIIKHIYELDYFGLDKKIPLFYYE